MNFKDKVYEVVKEVKSGEVMTYKEVAMRAGKPLAFRAVGNILNKNTKKGVPCHRVIRSDGKIGGYNGLQGQKRKLLVEEGFLK